MIEMEKSACGYSAAPKHPTLSKLSGLSQLKSLVLNYICNLNQRLETPEGALWKSVYTCFNSRLIDCSRSLYLIKCPPCVSLLLLFYSDPLSVN